MMIPSTKIAQMVQLCWTKWPQELKIENSLKDISSWTIGAKSKKFHTNEMPSFKFAQLIDKQEKLKDKQGNEVVCI